MSGVLFEVRRFVRPVSLVALAAWLAAPPPVRAAAPAPVPGSRVLVMPFVAEVDQAAPGGAGAALWLGEAAAVLVADELNAMGFRALSRDARVSAFDRLGLPMSPTLMRATILRVGEVIGASEIVFGEVRLGARLSVRAHLVSLGPGRLLPEVTDAAALEDIFPLFHRVSEALARQTGRPIGTVPAPPPLPVEAFENYVKGLVAATPAAQQRFLETAMTLAPGDPRILTALWSVYTAQGAPEKALAVASSVPADSTYGRRARLAAGLSLIELKRYDGAFEELTKLHAEAPWGAVSNALGVVQLRRGAPPGTPSAASYFARAAEESPGNTDYLFNLGYASALAGDAPSALLWLRETVRYDAANGDAHRVMSAVLASSGRRAEAQREFDLAGLLGARPEAGAARVTSVVPPDLERLSQQLDESPQVDAAIGNPAERDQREVAAFHRDAGRRLLAEGRDREAIDELRRAVYLSPYEDESHLLLGRLYQRGGRLDEAIDEFKVALWCRETAAGRVALGAAYLEDGDREAARREASRALVLDPGSAEAAALLKKIGG